jgi:hypothetical protein
VKVYLGDFLDDFEQTVGFFQRIDLFLELKFLDNLARMRREPSHIVTQVCRQFVGIAQQRLKGEFAGVVKAQVEFAVDHLLDGVNIVFTFRLELVVHGDDFALAAFEHAIQAAQHGERNHHPAVLWRSIWAADEIGDVPNDVALLFDGI